MPDFSQIMKQAARMEQDMKRVQAELSARTVEASSGGGAVKVTARCDGTVAAIKIDPAAASAGDIALLEDLVLSAVTQALDNARELAAAEMAKVTKGLNLPGLH